MNENLLYQNFVPLSRVVNAATLDMWEDKGRSQQVYTHWAARGLMELNSHILKGGIRRVLLHVNANTKTATLPADYNGKVFIGFIDERGIKIPLDIDTGLTNTQSITDVPCEDKCPKCNANKAICDDLTITVETVVVVINSVNYDQTITKKLYPNGDYYLESVIPYLDIDTDTVNYRTSKEFIAHIDLTDCGCVECTDENISTIRNCCPDVYCNYFAPCGCADIDNGGYSIFEDTGLIQLSRKFKYSKVYLEYRASMLKINGQYQVPKIAFEALVEWIKYKAIQNKRNVSRLDRNDQWNHYIIAKGNLSKVKNRVSISNILFAALKTPKFDVFVEYDYHYTTPTVTSVTTDTSCDVSNRNDSGGSGGGGSVPPAPTSGYVPFSFGVIAGMPNAPVDQEDFWQSDSLKGALNLVSFILNDTNYTLAKGDFSFDSSTGTIRLNNGNVFFTGDVLVGTYFKIL